MRKSKKSKVPNLQKKSPTVDDSDEKMTSEITKKSSKKHKDEDDDDIGEEAYKKIKNVESKTTKKIN